MTLQNSDNFVVNRSSVNYSIQSEKLVATLQDTDLMVVGRGSTPYKITGKEVKDSLGGGGGIFPSDNDLTISPSVPGSGTALDPYILATRTAAPAGSTILTSEIITFTEQPPDTNVVWKDNSTGAGTRFNQPVTQTDSSGLWSGQLQYADVPDSTQDVDYVGDLQIGVLHFRWTVDQKLVAELPTVVNSVLLVDSSPKGDRFTNSEFVFTSNIDDGVPLAEKTFDAYVSGTFDTELTPRTSAVQVANNQEGGWTETKLAADSSFRGVAYGNGVYVGIRNGEDCLVRSTDNGQTWQASSTGPQLIVANGIAYGNGKFVVVGYGYSGGDKNILVSSDNGQSFSSYKTDDSAGNNDTRWEAIAFDGSKFQIASKHSATKPTTFKESSDGASWAVVFYPTLTYASVQSLASDGNGNCVAGMYITENSGGGFTGDQVMFLYKGANTAWESAALSPLDRQWANIVYGENKFIAFNGYTASGLIAAVSTDNGRTWTENTLPSNPDNRLYINGAYKDGLFVVLAVNTPGYQTTSTDGVTWSAPTEAGITSTATGDIAVGPTEMILGGYEGKIYKNPTGLTSAITTLTLTDSKTYDADSGADVGIPINQTFLAGDTVTAESLTPPADTPAFSTTVYTGNDSTQSIVSGIDNTDKSLVWIKNTTSSSDHWWFDTARPFAYKLSSNNTSPEASASVNFKSFDDDGFTIAGNGTAINSSSSSYVAWNFRPAPTFFDIQTYTGNGGNQAIAHQLTTKPGMMIIKSTKTSENWAVYHQDLPGADALWFNTSTSAFSGNFFNEAPTANGFTVKFNGGINSGSVNDSGKDYVAYLFADVLGLIKCGSYTGDGNADGIRVIDPGFAPAWCLIKRTDGSGDWYLYDDKRVWSYLLANEANQEVSANAKTVLLGNNGMSFFGDNGGPENILGAEYIYVAIAKDAKPGGAVTGTVASAIDNILTLTDVSGTWAVGDYAVAPETIKPSTKLYLDFDSSGNVSSLLFSPMDPPYTTSATNPGLTLTFPPVFPTGNTPDDELGPNTVLTVGVVSENSSSRSPATGFEEASVQPTGDPAVADMFSTTLYTGDNTAQSVVSGIDNTGKSLVWIKARDNTYSHTLQDTVQGPGYNLSSDKADAAVSDDNYITEFISNGFNLGTRSSVNQGSLVAWNWRAAPGFFDIQTYTGDGAAGHQISHSLASVPNMMIIKRTDESGEWLVNHVGIGLGQGRLFLNQTEASATGSAAAYWNSTAPTETNFTVGGDSNVNQSGGEYVAYLFADTPGLIKCGSYDGTGYVLDVDCGFEPQWVMIKNVTVGNSFTNWLICDNKRPDVLGANLSTEEGGQYISNEMINFISNGFNLPAGRQSNNNDANNYIYVAIAAPVIETMTVEQFTATQAAFLTYQNREQVKQGEEALEARDQVMTEVENLNLALDWANHTIGK